MDQHGIDRSHCCPHDLEMLPGRLLQQLLVEPAAVIVILVLLRQVLEFRARSKTSRALKALLGLAPRTARVVLIDGGEEDVPLEHVHVGDRLRMRRARTFPLTASCFRELAPVDESMITGEPIPVEKMHGHKVAGGTVNGTGSFLMRAEKVGNETLLAQIVRIVSEAQGTRAPIQRLAGFRRRVFCALGDSRGSPTTSAVGEQLRIDRSNRLPYHRVMRFEADCPSVACHRPSLSCVEDFRSTLDSSARGLHRRHFSPHGESVGDPCCGPGGLRGIRNFRRCAEARLEPVPRPE